MSDTKTYLAPILRNEFVLAYRFGYLQLPMSTSVLLDYEEVEQLDKPSMKSKVLYAFQRATPFEYDEEYVILVFNLDASQINNFVKIELEQVQKVIPLSQQAKQAIEMKNTQLKLSKPYFEPYIEEIKDIFYRQEHCQGVAYIWKCLDMEGEYGDWQKYLNTIGFDKLYKGIEYRNKGIRANQINPPFEKGKTKKGKEHFWTYVMAYDRYEAYPESSLGYYFDLSEIFSYTKGLNPENISATAIYKLLNIFLEQDREVNRVFSSKFIEEKLVDYDNIAKYNIKIEKIDRFNQDMKEFSGLAELAKSSVTLYLKLKSNLLQNKDNLENSDLFGKLDSYKEHYANALPYSIILLGSFFGREKFADLYYEKLKLPFMKSTVPDKSIEKTTPAYTPSDENPHNSSDQNLRDTLTPPSKETFTGNNGSLDIKEEYNSDYASSNSDDTAENQKNIITKGSKINEKNESETFDTPEKTDNKTNSGLTDDEKHYFELTNVIEELLDKESDKRLSKTKLYEGLKDHKLYDSKRYPKATRSLVEWIETSDLGKEKFKVEKKGNVTHIKLSGGQKEII